MDTVLKTIYKSVVSLDQIVINCVENDFVFNHLSEEFLKFCKKTLVVSNDYLDYQQIFGTKSDKSVDIIIDNYLKFYNNNNFGTNNKWIPKNDLINYFKKNNENFKTFYSIINESLFDYLLKKCIFFEEIGFDCYQQINGFSITNNIWQRIQTNDNYFKSKPKFDLTVKVKDKKFIRSIERQIQTKSNVSLKRKVSEESKTVKFIKTNDSQRVVNITHNSKRDDKKWQMRGKSCQIVRKLMLYSRQTSGRFSKSFILEKQCLQCHQLFANIFNESLRPQMSFDTKKKLWPLLNHIIVRHKSCRYDLLLDKYCPIDPGFFDKYDYELRYALELYSTHKQMVKFLYSVLYFVFPVQLFGNKSNFNAFFENSKLLITCGLYTVLYFPDIKNKIKLSEIKWIEESNDLTKDLIFDSLIRWSVEYISTLLKSKFYITESMKSKALFFYRFDLWNKMKTLAINGLVKEDYLQPIDSKQLSEVMPKDPTNVLCLSTYRFIPKRNNFRLINKLKPMVSSLFSAKEMNKLLKLTLIVLKKMRNSINPSINSYKTLHQNILKLKLENKKLFFIRADINNCYPTINQKKLFEIIEQLFEGISLDNRVIIREFDRIIRYNKRLFVQHIRYIDNQNERFEPKIAINNNNKLQNCIIVSKSYKNCYSCENIKNYIKTYIFNAIIKVSKNSYYRINCGIRQGGMLSSELSSIYIESFANKYFEDLCLMPSEVRLIQADDFLFITPSYLKALRIVEKLKNMSNFEEYNLSINWNKLKTNFEINEINYHLSNETKFFGHLIDINSLTVGSDFSIYWDQFIINTFNCNPNYSLKHIISSILGQISLHISPLLLDNRVNGIRIVAKNIFERVFLQSLRLSAFIRVSKWKSKQNISFILNFTLKISHLIYYLGKKWTQLELTQFCLTYDEVKYIAVNAVLNQWTFGQISHRKNERNALKLLKQNIEISLKQSVLFNNYLDFIPSKGLPQNFNQILLN